MKKTTVSNAFQLGVKDAIAQGPNFASGITWEDATLNESYDRGVNAGLGLLRLRDDLVEATNSGALDCLTECAGHPDVTNAFCDAARDTVKFYRFAHPRPHLKYRKDEE